MFLKKSEIAVEILSKSTFLFGFVILKHRVGWSELSSLIAILVLVLLIKSESS